MIWVFDGIVMSHINMAPIGALMMQSELLSERLYGHHKRFRHVIYRKNSSQQVWKNYMFKPPHRRRALSVSLVVLGGVLIFLAPDNVWIGAVLAIAGIVIELIAVKLAHSNDEKK
jgi:hypothetical protein